MAKTRNGVIAALDIGTSKVVCFVARVDGQGLRVVGIGHQPSLGMRSGNIVVEALSYIRGRSIANQFMIIDEAQNLTPLEAKTIITRVGTGTKIIFTGDPYQIDNPYVDSSSNGFNYVVSRFRELDAILLHLVHAQIIQIAC